MTTECLENPEIHIFKIIQKIGETTLLYVFVGPRDASINVILKKIETDGMDALTVAELDNLEAEFAGQSDLGPILGFRHIYDQPHSKNIT